ncbi:hypothetical protein LGM38_02305 [Burkholderia vietnamiensis]|uniref:hypothetical protein n=1 Tax=Burkholderia vietnamiensis TaxID=60552 RepID=UPI001CF4933F|nr:hypothetical protein [Burkholderia vietnamiensis]MCA8010897.1 hypothetical protein [Burkholderia vietnamiensis]HDR8937556.1 hypothetical protein [Burkholderia vietnamiensis]HDR9263459.1 hypothetical protein [Burkholderia vietnamiensis]
MDAKSIYPLVTVGGFQFYDVKAASLEKKQRFKSMPIGGKITYRKGRELVAVDAWKRFSRFDHRGIVWLRKAVGALRSGPSWKFMRWYRNSNVLALYTWLITIIFVAYVARLVIYRDPNITAEEASHALEVYGTLITYIGTVWIGAGVALTSNERDTLRRLSKKKKSINTSNFDLASALLKAAKLGVEGIYIMTGGLALLALHFAYEGLHH